MANLYKIPTPADLLKAAEPRTGPPVANMGGIPTQGMAAQRQTFPQAPALNSAPPGPAPAAQPAAPAAAPVAAPATAPTAAPTTAAPSGAPMFNFNFGGTTPAAPAPDPYGPTPAPGQAGPSGEIWPDAQAPAIPEAPYRPVRTMAHVPRRFEVDSLAPGEGATTPLGDVYRDGATGKLKLKMNEQGKAAWRQKTQERLKKFGAYPMSHDPMAPTPDVSPGQPVFNPFAGTWVD